MEIMGWKSKVCESMFCNKIVSTKSTALNEILYDSTLYFPLAHMYEVSVEEAREIS